MLLKFVAVSVTAPAHITAPAGRTASAKLEEEMLSVPEVVDATSPDKAAVVVDASESAVISALADPLTLIIAHPAKEYTALHFRPSTDIVPPLTTANENADDWVGLVGAKEQLVTVSDDALQPRRAECDPPSDAPTTNSSCASSTTALVAITAPLDPQSSSTPTVTGVSVPLPVTFVV
jgi:hypothetical protein